MFASSKNILLNPKLSSYVNTNNKLQQKNKIKKNERKHVPNHVLPNKTHKQHISRPFQQHKQQPNKMKQQLKNPKSPTSPYLLKSTAISKALSNNNAVKDKKSLNNKSNTRAHTDIFKSRKEVVKMLVASVSIYFLSYLPFQVNQLI